MPYAKGGQIAAREPHAALWAFRKFIFIFFYFYCKVQKCYKMELWQLAWRTVLLLQVVPKRIMMSQKRRLQINSCFYIFMLRLFVTWFLRYAAHTYSRFGHPCHSWFSTAFIPREQFYMIYLYLLIFSDGDLQATGPLPHALRKLFCWAY